MKRILYSTLALLGGAIVFSACNKNDDDDNTLPRYATVFNAMATVAPKPVTISVDAATGGSFQVGRSRLIIPPGAFRSPYGNPVAGLVSVEVLELLNKSEMVFSRILPVSNGEQLVSAGEFVIRANQNGTQLQMQDKVPFELRVPQYGRRDSAMRFFQGLQTNDTAINMVNWVPRGDRPDSTGIGNVVISGDTVSIISDSLGYVNADRFLDKPNYQTFTVTVKAPTGINLVSSQVAGFTLYDSYRAVWPMSIFINGQFSETHVPNIPVHFVVFTVVDGVFYGGIGRGVPATGGNYNVTLAPSTPASFKTLVEELN